MGETGEVMSAKAKKIVLAVLACGLLLVLPGCGHDQQLVSIDVEPNTYNFGLTTIPVNDDAGLTVQLRALGSYIHPPITKDITGQVTWSSNTPHMVTVTPAGLIEATGQECGNTLISATVTTNSSVGGISASGAVVIGTMTANVICFTGSSAAGTHVSPVLEAQLRGR
jgi:hypothetical protein